MVPLPCGKLGECATNHRLQRAAQCRKLRCRWRISQEEQDSPVNECSVELSSAPMAHRSFCKRFSLLPHGILFSQAVADNSTPAKAMHPRVHRVFRDSHVAFVAVAIFLVFRAGCSLSMRFVVGFSDYSKHSCCRNTSSKTLP